MNTTSPNCVHCADTGSLSKEPWADLDCAYCGIALERMRVEAWARRAAPTTNPIDVWNIYQYGKAAANHHTQ